MADQVSPQKKIRLIEEIDEIPKSASGKILRRKLVEKEREEAAVDRGDRRRRDGAGL